MTLNFFLANAQRTEESKRNRCLAKKGVFCVLGIEEQFSCNHFLWNLLPSDFVFFTVVLCYCGAYYYYLGLLCIGRGTTIELH